jgi:hypothetical protein
MHSIYIYFFNILNTQLVTHSIQSSGPIIEARKKGDPQEWPSRKWPPRMTPAIELCPAYLSSRVLDRNQFPTAIHDTMHWYSLVPAQTVACMVNPFESTSVTQTRNRKFSFLLSRSALEMLAVTVGADLNVFEKLMRSSVWSGGSHGVLHVPLSTLVCSSLLAAVRRDAQVAFPILWLGLRLGPPNDCCWRNLPISPSPEEEMWGVGGYQGLMRLKRQLFWADGRKLGAFPVQTWGSRWEDQSFDRLGQYERSDSASK